MRRVVLATAGGGDRFRLAVARNPWTRMKGLLGWRELSPGEGLWIIPCNSIHMWGMRFAIDAVFLDRNLQIVDVVRDLKPGAWLWPRWRAHSVVELAAGAAGRAGWDKGGRLELLECGDG